MTSERVPLSTRVARWIFGSGQLAAEEALKRATAAHAVLDLSAEEAHAAAMRELRDARVQARRLATQTPPPMPRAVSIPDV
jgi:hypothetical protein